MNKTVKTLIPVALMAATSTAQGVPLSNMLHELSINPTLLAEYKQNPIAVAKRFELTGDELALVEVGAGSAFMNEFEGKGNTCQAQIVHAFD